MKTCGYAFTRTGRPCSHRVAPDVLRCPAGHPCPPAGASDDRLIAAIVASGARQEVASPTGGRGDRGRRATELLGRALAHDDAEHQGCLAAEVLADPASATLLLGNPGASPMASDAVVQRYGRIGALLVIGYEDRWRRQEDRGETGAAGGPGPSDTVGGQLEFLLRHFVDLDSFQLDHVLREIDRAEGRDCGGEAVAARRWMHATYCVAARDGTDEAHYDYMSALDRVMRLARPLIAS